MEEPGSTYERPHVLLMVETSIAYGRGILAGITRWLRRHRGWSLYLEQHELGASPPAWLADWRGDGVICRVTDPGVAVVLRQGGMPVIDLNDLHDDLGFTGFVRMPDGTIYVSECRSARIRVISPDRTSFRFITSPVMKHAATIAVVEGGSEARER